MTTKKNIIQIIPAAGWYAVFKNDGGEISSPLMCWAMVLGEDGYHDVVGIDCDGDGMVDYSDDANNFARYEYRPSLAPTLLASLKEMVACSKTCGYDCEQGNLMDARQRAEAVIAKAAGEAK